MSKQKVTGIFDVLSKINTGEVSEAMFSIAKVKSFFADGVAWFDPEWRYELAIVLLDAADELVDVTKTEFDDAIVAELRRLLPYLKVAADASRNVIEEGKNSINNIMELI